MLRIFITDLAAYNQGHLVGQWVQLPIDSEDLDQVIQSILSDGQIICKDYSIHEEYFIADYEWIDVELFTIDEYENIESLNHKLLELDNANPLSDELKAVKFLIAFNYATSLDEAMNLYDDVIIHSNMDMSDIAYEYLDSCYDLDGLPANLGSYIDFEKFGRDLEIEGIFHQVDSDIYEFRN